MAFLWPAGEVREPQGSPGLTPAGAEQLSWVGWPGLSPLSEQKGRLGNSGHASRMKASASPVCFAHGCFQLGIHLESSVKYPLRWWEEVGYHFLLVLFP